MLQNFNREMTYTSVGELVGVRGTSILCGSCGATLGETNGVMETHTHWNISIKDEDQETGQLIYGNLNKQQFDLNCLWKLNEKKY